MVGRNSRESSFHVVTRPSVASSHVGMLVTRTYVTHKLSVFGDYTGRCRHRKSCYYTATYFRLQAYFSEVRSLTHIEETFTRNLHCKFFVQILIQVRAGSCTNLCRIELRSSVQETCSRKKTILVRYSQGPL